MRIAINHRTRYRFTDPQSRLIQMLRLTPQDSVDQTVVNWHIGVDCDARLREGRDGYGNRVTMLYAEGPIESIELSVEGEVLTAGDAGLVRGVAEPLPPGLFCRVTDRTIAGAKLAEWAADLTGSPLDRLHALNLNLHGRFSVREQRADTGLRAEDAFRLEHASPRDLAHMLIAVARGWGVPTRYVSGYRNREGGEGHAPHAWVEAHVDGLGWVAFDPSRGISADANYVRVAVALDAHGAAPVAGSRMGDGEETLDVAVQVSRMTGDA